MIVESHGGVHSLFKNHSDDRRLFGPKEKRWDVKTSYWSGGIDMPRVISGDALYDINQQCSLNFHFLLCLESILRCPVAQTMACDQSFSFDRTWEMSRSC